ncbi:MAG: glycoside hydrolase family 5 protein [Oscillospiraceae bacterium]|jgi:endoglucanase|nr:glycoside hydrolase family 5 protein [Oscillospiraceae bacterium]
MRKVSALILVLALLLASCAVASPSATDGGDKPPVTVTEPAESPDGGEEPPAAKDLTSLEMARLMGYGINLGNTMEACDSKNRIPGRDPSVYETMWGQPVTTRDMVKGMKDAGFQTLRVPIAWTNAMDFENGDYTIGRAYLDRVEEIIDYALDEGMYVVINDHWDHGWWSMFSHPEQAVRDKAMDIFVSMWTQIAERYEKYDNRLIFEPANEEWGNRFNDKTPFNPTGGNLTQDECYELLTVAAQKFVDTMRGLGGNNASRFLLIPGYNTDVAMTCDGRFKMPTDTAGNKLLLSVHYYTPWSYCGDTSGVGQWGTTGDVEEQNTLLEMLTKYTAQGYGIVLGEWGVLDNEGEDRLGYFNNFLTNCDLYGYCPLLWDTGGLFDRSGTRALNAPDIARLFKDRSTARDSLTREEIVVNARDNIAWMLKKAADRPEFVVEASEAFAWIMFSSGDWSTQYSVGDAYKPESITAGAVATDVEVTGPGTYEVALDFTGTGAGYADGIVFAAVGLINGEILFPGYIMDIKEIRINGEPAEPSGKLYTTSDNKVCTRVNLYNEWVSDIPAEARAAGGDLTGATPAPLEHYVNEHIETITVIFDYIEG